MCTFLPCDKWGWFPYLSVEMGAANLCWLWERLNLCASPNQRAADWLEVHTLVYIVVTIAVHDPLGIFCDCFSLVPAPCPHVVLIWLGFVSWPVVEIGCRAEPSHLLSSSPAPHLC